MQYEIQNGVLTISADPEDGKITFSMSSLALPNGTWTEGEKSGRYRASLGDMFTVICYESRSYSYGQSGGYSLRGEWVDSPGYDSRGTHSEEVEYKRFSSPLHESDKAPAFSGVEVVAGYGYNGRTPVFILADPATREAVAVFVEGRGHWRTAKRGIRLTDKWSGKPDPRLDRALKQGFILL